MIRFATRWSGVSISTRSPAADSLAVTALNGAGFSGIRLCGIRHHGPGSARALRELLHRDPADIVLIEGPAEADGIAALAVDPEMQPPVALLGHVLDHPERAAFYPFASFSPEWVALTWALQHGVPVRFIDLPLRYSLAPPPPVQQGVLVDAGTSAGPHLVRRPIDPLGELSRAAGYDDPERWWEDVLEHRESLAAAATPQHDGGVIDLGPFVAIAEAMTAVRAVVEPTGVLADPVEARREAHMRTGIRAAVSDGFQRVVVVCGAWHVPALADCLTPISARRDKAVLRALPKVKVAITWVPWTHRRLASATGYGAGVTAPGWYHHLFTHAGPDVIARWFTEVARVLRAADYPTSAADVVEAVRLADALAALRGRPLPGFSEVDDVARAVLGGGTDTPMRLISRELVVGAQIGRVPTATPMVPLARNLLNEQRRCRLKPAAGVRSLELDLRKSLDLQRSQLLHRLLVLDVSWGIPSEGRGSTGTFRETWQLRWEPELDVRLIERAALGTTVEAAASAALSQDALAADTIGELTSLLEASLLAGLHDAVPGMVALVAERAAIADDVARLLEALPPLARTVRYGDVRSTDATSLESVVHSIVGRIAAGLAMACSGLDNDGARQFARLLRNGQSALALLTDRRQLAAFHSGLTALVEGNRLPGHVQGLATRLLADSQLMDSDVVERRWSRALSRGIEPSESAAFVEGFLGSSGAVLAHDPQLLGLLDRWLSSLPGDSFAEVLPLLRRTFGGFDTAERRVIGERVRTGEAPGTRRGRFELDSERSAAALITVGHLLGISR